MRPPEYQHPFDFRPARSFLIRLAIIIVLLIAAFQSISFYVESLWFGSLGFEPVYWYRLQAQAAVFFGVAVTTAIVLWLLFRLVMPTGGYSRRPFIQFGQEAIVIPTTETLKRLALPVAVIFGIFFGLSFSSDWNTFTSFINSAPTASIVDPIFGRPLSFYLFTLPVLESIAEWFLAISIIGLIASILLSVTDMSARFKGVSLALGILLVAIAFQTYVSRYSLLFEENTLFSGVRYVDDNIVIPGLWFVIAALLLGAVIALANTRAGRIRNLGVAIAMPALTYIVAGGLVPFYVTTFVVRPNELVRERQYIKNNIEFTRKAFALDRIEEIPFEPRLTNAVFNPAAHAETLENIRLWDWRALQATLQQIQEIRTYYDFPDIDVDRYLIDGKQQAVMLAARELSLNKLAFGAQNWVKEQLTD